MKTRFLMLIFATLVVTACGHDHGQSEADGQDHGTADHESWAVTAWGEHFELFPEIDALVAGKTATAHVHVTILDGFLPATEGSVAIILKGEGGAEERFSSTAVVRPGIFNVEITPATPGERELTFEIETGRTAETIPGGQVRVGTADDPGGLVEEPHALPPVDDGEGQGFLKEQQWRTSFATEWAAMGSMRPGVSGAARVEPPSGGRVMLTAPVNGVVRGEGWPYTGLHVEAGAPVLTLIPTTGTGRSLADLRATVRELEARSEAADSRVHRLENLLEKEAVSRREVEQARAEATAVEARLEAARAELEAAEAGRVGRGGVSGLQIRAPFAGRVAEVLVSPGEQVASGTALVRVIRERPVWVRVALTPDAASRLGDGIAGLILETGASSAALAVSSNDVRLVSIAPEVDAGTGTVEALIEVERSVDTLRPGLRATAQVLLPGDIEGMLLPLSAVIDDAGVSVVYVQLDGESFLRREVEVGECRGSFAVVDGVFPGERVVTDGGASIRRASLLSSGSVEGHVH
jgi:RND family efflux transporter MFP subunit